MENTYLKKIILILITIGLMGCDKSKDISCPVYNVMPALASEPSSSLSYIPNFWPNNSYDIIYVKDSTPDACYAYALDFVENQEIISHDSNGCDLYPHVWEGVDEVKDEFINDFEDLSMEQVAEFSKNLCEYNSDDVEILDYEIEDNGALKLNVLDNGVKFKVYINKSRMSDLACPLYNLRCYAYCDEENYNACYSQISNLEEK